MTTFKIPLLAVALTVVAVCHFGSADPRDPVEMCKSVLASKYGNNRQTVGVSNFIYSFLEKTECSIKIDNRCKGSSESNEDQLSRGISYALQLHYFRILFHDNKLDTEDVLGLKDWCKQESPKVLKHVIEVSPACTRGSQWNEEVMYKTCITYVDYLGIVDVENLSDEQDALKWFYDHYTPDMVTKEIIFYDKVTTEVQDNRKQNLFFLEKFTVAFYKTYELFVRSLATSSTGTFESVDDFCTKEGKRIVEENQISE